MNTYQIFSKNYVRHLQAVGIKHAFCFAVLVGFVASSAYAQQGPGNLTANCSGKRATLPECKTLAKRPAALRPDAPNPPAVRKPPRAPKQTSGTKDELPERREDNF